MKRPKHLSSRAHWIAVAAFAATLPIQASQMYVTGWIDSTPPSNVSYANICNNLNQQFPNSDLQSGASCTPSTGASTPNAQYLYNPSTYTSTNAISGFPNVSNGVEFDLTSNSSGKDYAQINSGSAYGVSVGLSNVDAVYLLMAAYNSQTFSIAFSGTGAATQTFSNINIPDFCNGATQNSSTGGVVEFTAFRVQDQGGCGSGNSSTGGNDNYDLTEVAFTLSSAFSGQTLNTASITSNGYETLLLGVTADVAGQGSAAPEPSPLALAALGVGLLALGLRRSSARG